MRISKSKGLLGIGCSVIVLWVAMVGLMAAPAFAAPPTPSVTVSEVTTTSATFNGTLTPGEFGATYEFNYGKAGAPCVDEKQAPEGSEGFSTGEEALPAEPVANLVPGTEYLVCLHVWNEAHTEETESSAARFTTAPETPLTREAKSVTASSATLNGVLNPSAIGTAGYEFEYAAGESCEGGLTTTGGGEKTGKGIAVAESVTGLESSTEYTFCVVAVNSAGESAVGNPSSFTTAPAAPKVDGESISGEAPFGVTLEAQVNPENQQSTSCVFEYGESTSYGKKAPCSPATVEGVGDQGVSAAIAGLEPNKAYHFRVVVGNATGVTDGPDQPFKTPVAEAPKVESEAASGVSATGGRLEAQVNPDYQETSYSFEYSTQAGGTPLALEGSIVTVKGTSSLAADGGVQTAGVATGVLAPGTTYYYRVVASNATPPATDGAVKEFTTVPVPTVSAPVGSVTATTASFSGELKPLNKNVAAKYHFVYNVGASCAGGSETATEEAGTGAGTAFKVPATPVTGLEPDVEYTVCLVATNEFAPGEVGLETSAPVHFTTLAAPPTIDSEGTSGVTPYEAKLEALLNPNNQKTTYKFEYSAQGKTGAGETLDAPVTNLAGAATLEGFGEQTASVATGRVLTSDTPYFYRVVATNAKGEVEKGKVAKFTTETATAPVIEAETATAITAIDAKLNAQVNPDYQTTTVVFEYASEESVVLAGNGTKVTAPSIAAVGGGQAVSVDLAGALKPGTKYFFRVIATNGTGTSENTGGIEHFTTQPATAPKIEELSATEVASTSATFDATIDPGNLATAYTFEYAPAGGTFSPVPEPEATGTIAEGTTGVQVSVHMQQGLLPDASYQFRVLVSNALGAETGAAQTFTTHAAGGEFKLPDNRAWEQVSPVDKQGARVSAITKEGGVIQAAENGSAITYVTSAPPVKDPEGNVAIGESQIVSTRGEGGWSSRDITTPHEKVLYGPPLGNQGEYYVFSPDLSRGVVEPSHKKEPTGNTPLSPQDPEATIYLREGLLESEGAHYVPLGKPPVGAEGFEGASGNLEHVIFSGNEWTAGTVSPVFIPPEGEPAGPFALGSGANVRNAVSENGQRVFFEAILESGKGLFMRNTAEARTVRLDLPQGGAKPTGNPSAVFQYATPDGSRVYFTDVQSLTPNSTAAVGEPELYEYNTLTGVLTDLTPNPNPTGTASTAVSGVVEVSETGEYIYFIANSVLGGPATGADLYVAHVEGAGSSEKVTTRLVAVLSGDDSPDFSSKGNPPNNKLQQITSRVSPNGRYFAFMSDRSLTGYDNKDAVSGASDEEVFVYDALTKRLVCASCDPTGARPHGVLDPNALEPSYSDEGLGLLVDRPEIWEGHRLAGSIPGWTAFGYSGTGHSGAQYQSRYLSNDGRLFFNSADALVPQDTNGKEDVYEYEPEGNDCDSGTVSGSEVYKPGSAAEVEGRPVEEGAGCVALISSGSSSTESAFLDASGKGPGGEEAEDVFFLTASQLVSQDSDTADDVYDAHVCSTAAPCASSAIVSPPCTTTDSCRLAPAAQPSIYGAPASATFSGQGNAAPVTTVPKKVTKKAVKCKRGYVKKKNKCVKSRKAKRAGHNRRSK